MKKVALISLAVLLLISLPVAIAQTGNGSESGGHFNLNLIGQVGCKNVPMTDSNRHTIFVALNYNDPTPTSPTPDAGTTTLSPKNKIFLQEGPFAVIDGNACDGATFQLPQNSCTSYEGEDATGCEYNVYIRGLGSPKNNPYAEMTTCRVDTSADPDLYQCSTETVTVERRKGKSTFDNVTKELTTLCLDVGGTTCQRVQLFTDKLYKYYWDYDNFGLRLAQLRFYPQ